MTAGSAAVRSRWKNAVRMSLSLFRSPFNSSKCKTNAKMAVARVKLLRNKRQVVIKQMRRDIAMLLESGQDATARIRVEHVIREQNIMAANELIELFCELVVARLSIIAKQRYPARRQECPADLKEGVSSLIFAAPRCSDIPELFSIRDVFQKKYGKDFVSAATDLRPNAGVNRMLIEKLSVKNPSGEVKLKVLKEIAKEYQVEWDTTESEMELLKTIEERIEGPTNFVSATSLPVKAAEKRSPAPKNSTNSGLGNIKNIQDLASEAGEAAEKAMAAAEAASRLAYASTSISGSRQSMNHDTFSGSRNSSIEIKPNSSASWKSDGQTILKHSEWDNMQEEQSDARKISRRQSYNCERTHSDIKFDESDADEELEMEQPPPTIVRQSSNGSVRRDTRKINRRHSHNVPPAQTDIKFDESDGDNPGEKGDDDEPNHLPPESPAPQVPGRRVHPKLPDYDALAARFEALKLHRKQT